ncbi:MAG: addiction module antidote protein [Burkholderiales bacterium]
MVRNYKHVGAGNVAADRVRQYACDARGFLAQAGSGAQAVAYTTNAFAHRDGSLVRAALCDVARARGISQLARDTGTSREGLHKALSSTGNPEFSTVHKVAPALGIRLRVVPAT